MTDDTLIQIQSFLTSHTTLSLATINSSGGPYTAPLFYAQAKDLKLIFTSEKKTMHAQNISQDKRVSGAIYADGQEWGSIQGIQFEGICVELSGVDLREAKAIYTAKYPFIAKNTLLKLAVIKAAFYQITPNWIRLVDNTRGFGFKQEIHLKL